MLSFPSHTTGMPVRTGRIEKLKSLVAGVPETEPPRRKNPATFQQRGSCRVAS